MKLYEIIIEASDSVFSGKGVQNVSNDIPMGKKSLPKNRITNPGAFKLSDEQVRDIRRKYQKQNVSRVKIYAEYPEVTPKYLDNILEYKTRLSPKCDIDYKGK